MQSNKRITIALTAVGAALVTAGAVALSLADIKRNCWECPKCGELFTPTFGQYILGVHTIHKRMLKCPSCGNTSMCESYARDEIFE